MKKWHPLQPGDLIDVVAPASSCTDRELKQAIHFVERFGLVPRVPADIFHNDIVVSNTDDYRFRHLRRALLARDSKAVWCLRGGYGSARILPQLQRLKAPTSPKLFIGYSDITALHTFFNLRWGWPTLHATMLESFGKGEGGRREVNEMKQILYGHESEVLFNNLVPMNAAAKKRKLVRAPVVGGNLAVLVSLFGTGLQPSAQGKIVMLEDIGERGYRVDRMLVQMKQAGYFKGIRALIFGDFVGGEEDDSTYLWKAVQSQFAEQAGFPVLKGLPCGHGVFQRPLPLMTRAQLKLGNRATLSVDAGFK